MTLGGQYEIVPVNLLIVVDILAGDGSGRGRPCRRCAWRLHSVVMLIPEPKIPRFDPAAQSGGERTGVVSSARVPHELMLESVEGSFHVADGILPTGRRTPGRGTVWHGRFDVPYQDGVPTANQEEHEQNHQVF